MTDNSAALLFSFCFLPFLFTKRKSIPRYAGFPFTGCRNLLQTKISKKSHRKKILSTFRFKFQDLTTNLRKIFSRNCSSALIRCSLGNKPWKDSIKVRKFFGYHAKSFHSQPEKRYKFIFVSRI